MLNEIKILMRAVQEMRDKLVEMDRELEKLIKIAVDNKKEE